MRIRHARPEALGALLLLLGTAGCSRFADDEAVALVRAYNRRIIEAYATNDPRRVEEVAGPEEAKKILGLVGVKADMGLSLHARMDEFKVAGVVREGDEIVVRSHERWSYEDRSIASGALVGSRSFDSYDMRYHLAHVDGRWVVVRVEFASPPHVGRKEAPVTAPPDVFHGSTPGDAPGASSTGGAR